MAGDRGRDDADSRSGITGEVKDLLDLMRDYAKQETLGPLKGVGRFIGFGVAGSVVLSIGAVLLGLAGLRALQTETGTNFTGNLSWIPYFIMLIVAAVVIAISVMAITRKSGDKS